MACGPLQTAVERAFTAALEAAVSYAIDGDTLELAGADGHVSLRFCVAQPPSLVGTRWLATMVHNGRGGESASSRGARSTPSSETTARSPAPVAATGTAARMHRTRRT